MTYGNVNVLWAAALVDELARSGVRQAVVSPGSRSTPLVLALAEHPDIADFNVIDERSAAFFALGLIRASERPVAVICTSGTATANYFPAICEADASNLPLIVVTADRPPELHDTGASQAMNQTHLYGSKVRFFHQFAQPEALESKFAYLRNMTCRAVAEAVHGPVHLNCAFRKPLENTQVDDTHPDSLHGLDLGHQAVAGRTGGKPWADYAEVHVSVERADALQAALNRSTRPVLFAGADTSSAAVEAAKNLRIPIIAETTSKARTPGVVPEFCTQVFGQSAPDLVLVTGRWPVDWPVIRWLEGLDTEFVFLRDDIQNNPNHKPGLVVPGDALAACEGEFARWSEWVQGGFERCLEAARATIKADDWFDGIAAQAVDESGASTVFVSSSMPLRDVEVFHHGSAPVFANRGLNGIDGVIATAVGVAHNRLGKTIALIGDVAFTHDIGSLKVLRDVAPDLTVVLINNGGGAIFDFLPVADGSDTYARHFTTEPNVDFEHVARGFGVEYAMVETRSDLVDAMAAPGPRVIEIRTDAARSRQVRKSFLTADVNLQAFDGGQINEPDDDIVVFLHGFTGQASDFDELIDLLPDQNHLTIDLPGHGKNQQVVESMDDVVEHVRSALEVNNVKKCHLFGYSMGGRVGIAFAAKYPDRVLSIATLGATPGLKTSDERTARQAIDRVRADNICKDLTSFMRSWVTQPFFATLTNRQGWLEQSFRRRLGNSAQGLSMALTSFGTGAQPSYWDQLATWEFPALFMYGELDSKYEEIAHAMAELTGSAKGIANTGHASHFEEPAAVAAALTEFWENA